MRGVIATSRASTEMVKMTSSHGAGLPPDVSVVSPVDVGGGVVFGRGVLVAGGTVLSLGVGVGDGVGVALSDGVGVTDGDGLSDGGGLAECEGLGVGVQFGLPANTLAAPSENKTSNARMLAAKR